MKGDFAGADFSGSKGLRIPVAAFPGNAGVLEAEFKAGSVNGPRHHQVLQTVRAEQVTGPA